MKDNHTHIIKSQQYHVVLDDAAKGHVYQSKISQLQEHEIQSVLQEVMDAHHIPQFLDIYDEIILDLGTISPANFERELGYRIAQAFDDFFKNDTYENGRLIKGRRKQIQTSWVAKFLFFLEHGYVPWDTPTTTTPATLLELSLLHHRETFITELKVIGKKEHIRKRLISQLQDPALEHIVITLKNEEGLLINTSREKMISYRSQYKIVDINKAYFRNAVWEIILAYIFTETSSVTNLTRFLKYIVRKIATKYNVTYKELLRKIVFGIQEENKNTRSIPHFEKTILLLYQETEKKAPVLHEQDDQIDFITLFNYFLNHNALPATSPITTSQQFYKQISRSIKEHSIPFYTFLYISLKQKGTPAHTYINRFPNQLLNLILSHAKDKVFVTITAFFTKLKTQAHKHSVTSTTLEKLPNSIGAIALHTYVVLQKKESAIIDEFLHQLIKTLTIDKAFIQLLKTLSKEPVYKSHQGIHTFIKDTSLEKYKFKSAQPIHNTPTASVFSKKLYSYYNGSKVLSQQQFHTLLTAANYGIMSFKLLLALLELHTKNKNCLQKTLVAWIVSQLRILDHKGNDTSRILIQIYEIAKTLYIDNRLLEAINQVKNTTTTHAETGSISLGSSPIIYPDTLPQKVYRQLIGQLITTFFEREQQDLYENTQNILEAFAQKNGVPKKVLVTALKKNVKNNSTPRYIHTVLERLENENTHPKNVTNSMAYYLEYVHYFFIHGRFPWWSTNTSRASFGQAMNTVLHQYPEQFVTWFKNSKNKKKSIDIMDDSTYEMLIKHINPSNAESIISSKKLITLLIEKDLSPLKNIVSEHYKVLNYAILEYIERNNKLDISRLLLHLTTVLATIFTISKKELNQLLIGRINYHKYVFKNSDNILSGFLSLAEVPIEPVPIDIIKKLAKEKLSWKDAISSDKPKTVSYYLTTFYKEHPQELKFHLKQVAFRHQLLYKLRVGEQKEVLNVFFSVIEQSKLQCFFEIFKNLRKTLKTALYQNAWNDFIHMVLLNVAIQPHTSWTNDRWSLLFLSSMRPALDSSTEEEVSKTIIQTTNGTKQLVDKVLDVMEQHATTVKLQQEPTIPQVTEVKKETVGDTIFIQNAGIVILGPYIPMLFDRMGLLEHGVFKNETAQNKALYALQYAVTGITNVEEQELVIHKIICGMELHTPIAPVPELHLEEKELIDDLLKAIISHWDSIGNTSVTGLRGSFLCRSGRISIEANKYVLLVEEKSYDMLLDKLPWSIGQLKLSWMEKLIEVIWRA